ncbi:hypothetical protein EII29_04830 [Leptotrichia sp. OH3620_COT-345]|uniref:hypothetical protein n=1 Tax=Leptotrichia sp. OH3620_COT-345 TaxID=2491048 RepID=UPI000F64C9EE|nr:hypothetical protein [Leptotrichia sp. OH3620_COT-345]RRD39850.1 hypothetical protein EII29_04830 [Leptotrichia sp. OH3620_COT-345]
MSDIILNINSENYNYIMIDSIYRKLLNRITDVEFDFRNDVKDVINVIESIFLINVNGNNIKLESRFFLHLLVFGYFIELENSENEGFYKVILNNFIKENMESYEEKLRKIRKISGMHFENESRKKLYDLLKDIYKVSEQIFVLIVSDVGKNQRDKILKQVIQKFNSSNRELDSIIKEKVSMDIKIRKCYDEIERIFDTFNITEIKEYNTEEINIGTYLLRIIKDSIKAIYINLIIERENPENSLKIFFNSNTWFIYFYSLLITRYKQDKSNLLKLSQNMDFLKFGADTYTVNKVMRDFIEKNNLKEMKKELNPEIFYFLLATGCGNKSIYSTTSIDGSCISEVNFADENGNKVFEKSLKIYKLNIDFAILDFVNMLFMNDNRNLKRYITEFIEKFYAGIEQYNEIEEISVEVEQALSNIFNNLEKSMTVKYNEIKNLYSMSTKRQKINMIKEFINILIQKVNKDLNSKKNILRNYKIAVEYLEKHMKCEIQISRDKISKDDIFITHNLTDNIRLENEKIMKKIMKTDFRTIEELISGYSADIEKINGKRNESVEILKEKLIKKYKNKSKMAVKVSIGTDINEQDDTNLIIYMKIFFLIIIYNKIKNSDYFLKLNGKLKKIYLSVVTDVIYMLNLKDNFLIQNLTSIKEYDYLREFSEKTESYFLSLHLNNEENIKKINRETVKEAEELLEVFRDALMDSYFYYEESCSELRGSENIFGEKEQYSATFTMKNRNTFDKDMQNTVDCLIRSFDLNKIFV